PPRLHRALRGRRLLPVVPDRLECRFAGATMTHATLHHWDSLPEEQLSSGVRRRYLTTDRVTMARFALSRGAVVRMHSHENEQVSHVLSGVVRFTIAGETIVARAGDVLQIPSLAEHGVEIVEDAVVIDVFSPVRQDWIDDKDAYLR